MKNMKNLPPIPHESEVKQAFYGHIQETLSSGSLNIPDVGLQEITSFSWGHIGYNSPISILKSENTDLLLYSVGGIGTLDVYNNYSERQEMNVFVRKAKKVLDK